jgi:hypothetical protein
MNLRFNHIDEKFSDLANIKNFILIMDDIFNIIIVPNYYIKGDNNNL